MSLRNIYLNSNYKKTVITAESYNGQIGTESYAQSFRVYTKTESRTHTARGSITIISYVIPLRHNNLKLFLQFLWSSQLYDCSTDLLTDTRSGRRSTAVFTSGNDLENF